MLSAAVINSPLLISGGVLCIFVYLLIFYIFLYSYFYFYCISFYFLQPYFSRREAGSVTHLRIV